MTGPGRLRARLALLTCLALMACQGATVRLDGGLPRAGLRSKATVVTPVTMVTREQKTLLQAMNSFRTARGLPPLEPSERARLAAERHAHDLRLSGELSHKGSDGSTVGDRISREGMAWCRVAENLARGYDSADLAVLGWANSPGHRRNLLGDYTMVGTARDGDFWVVVYVKPC